MRSVIGAMSAGVLLLFFTSQTVAQGPGRHLTIRQVVVDDVQNPTSITIVGENFLSGARTPTVTLGEFTDALVVLGTPTANEFVVMLPANVLPGDYLLGVSIGRWRHQSDEFNLTIAAAGPQGEAGPAGPQGETGPAGAAGASGNQGAPGAAGASGPGGPGGAQGPAGAQGIQGEQGPVGLQGNLALAGMMCAAGEFLQGFDASGQIVCMAPADDGTGDPPPPGVAVAPGPGDLFITELMIDSNVTPDSAGEWFEMLNVSSSSLELDGLVIRDDGSNSYQVQGSLIVLPGEYVVFGAANEFVDHVYTGFVLANSADEIELDLAGVSIDRFVYDATFAASFATGLAMGLDPGVVGSADVTARQDPANWCPSATPLPVGPDFGTPHAPNDICQ
jgi:hypothetical protein